MHSPDIADDVLYAVPRPPSLFTSASSGASYRADVLDGMSTLAALADGRRKPLLGYPCGASLGCEPSACLLADSVDQGAAASKKQTSLMGFLKRAPAAEPTPLAEDAAAALDDVDAAADDDLSLIHI